VCPYDKVQLIRQLNLLPLRTRAHWRAIKTEILVRHLARSKAAGRRSWWWAGLFQQMVILAPLRPGGGCPWLSLSLLLSSSLYEYVQISISNAINGAKADSRVLVTVCVSHSPLLPIRHVARANERTKGGAKRTRGGCTCSCVCVCVWFSCMR